MFINNRKIPVELLYYNALSARTDLTTSERYQMESIRKGYEGECLYDKIFDETGHKNLYIFRDVYLKIKNTTAQYDSIVISDDCVTINEIKNFQGDFRFSKDMWYKDERLLEDDAFTQLRRAKGNLMKINKDSDVQFEVKNALIFINDDFRLSSENDDIWEKTIVRSHLRKYLRNLNNSYRGEKAKEIANVINKYRVRNTFFNERPDTSRLRLGFYCGECKSFDLSKYRFHFKCNNCETIETKETHFLRALSDHKFLFYNEPVTKKSISHLIDNQLSKTTLLRFMNKHCNLIKKGSRSTHTFKYYDFNDAVKTITGGRYKNTIRKQSE
ncbi:Nuclease-related domain protein [Jeotgalicoccus saudimassiliensis]|uniref:Nuclease-related domain protein n=1 Tax=Jeotgalicoccus saudimassiliensis TaxID=1461582 RepID=A0A078LWP0_9STAP|nr:nuclease-related domain-containing protein [Jeotgalicoccus saudimassiliensis]CDZ99613.1 Nuclease-related domain protein [Jeotgalicoccus saudimassiliensis]